MIGASVGWLVGISVVVAYALLSVLAAGFYLGVAWSTRNTSRRALRVRERDLASDLGHPVTLRGRSPW